MISSQTKFTQILTLLGRTALVAGLAASLGTGCDDGADGAAATPSVGTSSRGDAGGPSPADAAEPALTAAFASLPIAPTKITKVTVSTPAKTGGIGSGLAWDARDGVYWMVTDQVQMMDDLPITLYRVKVTGDHSEIESAVAITDQGKTLTGGDLDPEGIALAPDGTLWLCDEKGPHLFQLNRKGELLKKVAPNDFLKGRQANRGLEGIAISPDGKTLFAVLQNGVEAEMDKLNTVIAAYDIAAGTFKFHPYRLEDPKAFDFAPDLMVPARTGAHDLFALDGRTLLVLERDNQAGDDARVKRVFKVELPAEPVSAPIAKTLVLDLRKHGYIFEQPEGMTLRAPRVLAIVNDNDGATIPTEVWEIAF